MIWVVVTLSVEALSYVKGRFGTVARNRSCELISKKLLDCCISIVTLSLHQKKSPQW